MPIPNWYSKPLSVQRIMRQNNVRYEISIQANDSDSLKERNSRRHISCQTIKQMVQVRAQQVV